MTNLISSGLGLLIIAVLVAIIARRLGLPYVVGLVVAGVCLAFSPIHLAVSLTRNVIFEVILPPLLFEAALNIQWKDLRQDALPILSLAIPGTVIAAVAITLAAYYGLNWPLTSSLMFGILIAATDPVAVIATFRDNHVHGRLRLLVESESLLNDGVAAVLFALALAWTEAAGQSHLQATGVIELLSTTIGGGILIGAACTALAILLAGRTEDYLVENTVTTVLAYASFLLAEHWHCSGVLATVTAGLLMGNINLIFKGRYSRVLTEKGREFSHALWEYIAFIANSLVFLLIGMTVAGIPFHAFTGKGLVLTIFVLFISRALTVYPIAALFSYSRWKISLKFQHILFWGGLRGALGMALALSLPQDLPLRREVIVATFAVVVFSVVVQGLTMPLLLNLLGITQRR